MEIFINQQAQFFQEQLTVQQLLDVLMPDKQKGIAVAIDSKVVPKSEWVTKMILDKNNVLIIKATQGG